MNADGSEVEFMEEGSGAYDYSVRSPDPRVRPKVSEEKYSDRYLPSRQASNLDCGLALLDETTRQPSAGHNIRSTSNPLLHTSTLGSFSAVSTPIFASKY